MLDHNVLRWCVLLTGLVLIAVASIPWTRWLNRAHAADDVGDPELVDRLEILFDPATHCACDAQESVQVLFTVRNAGRQRIRLSAVKIIDVVALSNKREASGHAAKVHAVPLELVGAKLHDPLDSGVPAQVRMVTASKHSGFIINSTDGQFYFLPAAKYRIRVVAAGRTGLPDEKSFLVWQSRRGILKCKMDTSSST